MLIFLSLSLEAQGTTETIPQLSQTMVSKSADKPKVVVQQIGRASNSSQDEMQKANIVNGQQPSQSLKEGNDSSSNKFILTPDYIQQS